LGNLDTALQVKGEKTVEYRNGYLVRAARNCAVLKVSSEVITDEILITQTILERL
jgi:hypothetical protein